jgi:LmbE family N-acetylglucosaminyl deacetylase
MKKHIFFSPHLDDAVLSCGALINKICRTGQIALVINIFSASPPPESLSIAALAYFEECELGADAMIRRKEEDAAALSYLGCQVQYLEFYESLHRTDEKGQFLYSKKENIFTDNLKNEALLIERLAIEFSLLLNDEKDAVLYSPLGIGTHIDHLLTRAAVEKAITKTGFDLLYYEDIPYVCCLPAKLTNRSAISNLNSLEKSFDENDCLAKFSAILKYKSQIRPLFENDDLMNSLLRSYASSFSNSYYAERYWFRE